MHAGWILLFILRFFGTGPAFPLSMQTPLGRGRPWKFSHATVFGQWSMVLKLDGADNGFDFY